MKSLVTAAAALSLASTAYAAVSKQCPTDGVCYSLSIPEQTASSGSGDIYFQIAAQTSYQWVAFGQGNNGMYGANIFVMYTSSDGKNVTVSPRLGKSEVEPLYNPAAQITLLEGSGVSGDQMIANVLCKSCTKWSGGSMDFSSSSGAFIYAYKSGDPLNSDSKTETIDKHDSASGLTWTISAAKGGSENVNPFVSSSSGSGSGSGTGSGSGSASSAIPLSCTPIAASAAASGTASSTLAAPSGSGCPTTWPSQYSTAWPTNAPAWVTACYPNGPPTGRFGPQATNAPFVKVEKRDNGCPSGYAPVDSGVTSDGPPGLTASESRWMPLAHGVLASLVFVGLLPIGGIIVRVANWTGLVWIHAVLQIVSFLIYIIAFGMGVYMATHMGLMSKAHPIIGVALFVILLAQPIFGILHHKLFKKYGHRTFWSYVHLFQGRIAIFLGMINGGLGIQLAGITSIGAKAAYGVITAIMALIYIAAIIMGELRRRKKGPPTYEKSQQAHQLRDLSSSEEQVAASRDQQHLDYYGRRDNRF